METMIPGIGAKHVVISDACRERGDAEALTLALQNIIDEYGRLTAGPWPKGKGAKFHLVLTVEYSQKGFV